MVAGMLSKRNDEAGALPIWALAVLISGLAAVLAFEPEQQTHTTLQEGLGPVVETQTL